MTKVKKRYITLVGAIIILIAFLSIGILSAKSSGLDTELYATFKKDFPLAEVINSKLMNIDNLGNGDLVILYNNPADSTKCNVAIITDNSFVTLNLSSADLSNEFVKKSKSLKINRNLKKIDVFIYNTKTHETYDHYITMNYNQKEQHLHLTTGSNKI